MPETKQSNSKPNYTFCQFLNPEEAHQGKPCDCFSRKYFDWASVSSHPAVTACECIIRVAGSVLSILLYVLYVCPVQLFMLDHMQSVHVGMTLSGAPLDAPAILIRSFWQVEVLLICNHKDVSHKGTDAFNHACNFSRITRQNQENSSWASQLSVTENQTQSHGCTPKAQWLLLSIWCILFLHIGCMYADYCLTDLEYSCSKNCPNVWQFCKHWCSINQINYIIFWK